MGWALGLDDLALLREAVMAGEWWRLWTGHLVHTGVRHLAWNLAALVILGFAAHRAGLARASLLYCFLSMPLISVGLLFMVPELQWYAGLSGILHGLIVLILVRKLDRVAWLGLGLLTTKLVLEAAGMWPALPGDHPVVNQAHILGFACGLIAGLIPHIRVSRRPVSDPGYRGSRPGNG